VLTIARGATAPLGTIQIDSPFPPPDVLDNLRARGREWRESAVPEDLKKLTVRNLAVATNGSTFQMQWTGNVSPLYNPLCFGTVQPYGNGSRIRAGFRLNRRAFIPIGYLPAMVIVSLIGGDRSTVIWVVVAIATVTVAFTLGWNRTSEPMRTRLVEVLTTAAQEPTSSHSALPRAMSTNGP
jgi:hypothetical protein